MLCYTSGTTGNPKGVLYEHRSTVLHAMVRDEPRRLRPQRPLGGAAGRADVPRRRLGPCPSATAMAGGKMVFSADYTPQVMCDLMQRRGRHPHRRRAHRLAGADQPCRFDRRGSRQAHDRPYRRLGGAAGDDRMVHRPRHPGRPRLGHDRDVAARHRRRAAAATGTSSSREQRVDLLCKQGRVPFGVELRTVDDEGNVLPRDGKTSGRLQTRGPWIIRQYFQDEQGDVHRRGRLVRHRRRRHPPSRRRAPDHRPLEGRDQVGRRMDQLDRPRKCRGRLPRRRRGGGGRGQASQMGRTAAAAGGAQGGRRRRRRRQILDHLAGHVAKWWLPDEIVFVDSLPHTATGKLLKTALREQYRDYKLASAA